MIYRVDVGVALSRPPKIDEYRTYAIEAGSKVEANILACQMAACTSVMPVWSKVVGMKVIVYHADYGCESGCCGHAVELENGETRFEFDHPYGMEDARTYAEDMVRGTFGEEHVADLDWDNCIIEGC